LPSRPDSASDSPGHPSVTVTVSDSPLGPARPQRRDGLWFRLVKPEPEPPATVSGFINLVCDRPAGPGPARSRQCLPQCIQRYTGCKLTRSNQLSSMQSVPAINFKHLKRVHDIVWDDKQWTVKRLVALCKDIGCDSHGSKAELRARLQLLANFSPKDPAVADTSNVDGEVAAHLASPIVKVVVTSTTHSCVHGLPPSSSAICFGHQDPDFSIIGGIKDDNDRLVERITVKSNRPAARQAEILHSFHSHPATAGCVRKYRRWTEAETSMLKEAVGR
jgi:hypothetical protein